MTEPEKEIVERLNHPLYTTKFIGEWENWDGNVFSNAPAALQSMGVCGFMEAVRQMEKQKYLITEE